MKSADWISSRIPARGRRVSSAPPVKLIAHRGAWRDRGCVENTLSAFDRARESGAWGIEFDVRWTKDGTPVVHHDPSLVRTFGRNLSIASMTLRTLRHEARLVPTLDEVIAEYKDSLNLMIELKGDRSEWTDARLQQVVRAVSALKPEEHYHFMSGDLALLEALVDRAGVSPKTLVPIATLAVNAFSDATLRRGYKALTSHWSLMTPKLIQRHHEAGQLCGVGFTASKPSLQREWARGIDWIFTDHIHLAGEWLHELEKST